jgi:hypothetical protein
VNKDKQLPAVDHGIGRIADNVSAGQGPLPDAKLRGKMREALEAS